MLDEMSGRLWAAHHDQFSQSVSRGIARLRQGFARFASWDGTTHQLLAIVAALAITGLGFTSTASA